MPPRTSTGIDLRGLAKGRLSGSTFVELVVTIFLLAAFSSLLFTIFWATTKADVSHSALTASQESQLSVAAFLPRLTEEIHPPYWAGTDKVFQNQGSDWKVFYRNGEDANFLIVRKQSDSRLELITPDSSLSIGNLAGLSIDWWKKDGRIIGLSVQWHQGNDTVVFHSAWGSLVL